MDNKSVVFFVVNIILLPIILMVGKQSPISIAIFWIASLVVALMYLRPKFKECGILFFLSPCILTWFYSIFNYVTGSLYYSIDVLSSTKLYLDFFRIDSTRLFLSLCYLNLCNTIVLYIGCKYPLKYYVPVQKTKRPEKVIPSILFLILFFVVLQFFIIDFSFVGGHSFSSDGKSGGSEAGLNFPLILGVIVLLCHKLNVYGFNKIIRLSIYSVLIVITAVGSVGSKRELFFMLIGILMVEMVFNNRKMKLTLRNIIVTTVVIALSVLYILTASITRGYGSFGVESFSEAIDYVPMYVQSETFNVVVGNNFETPFHYATSTIACDYVLSEKIPLLYGSSFLKVLFIPIPRSVFDYKPQKMVDAFTRAYEPFFRQEGGSYPVSAYSEFLANFHILGILFLVLFFMGFQKLYIKTMKGAQKGNISYIYMVPFFALFLHFVRGSGFESLVIYSILAFASIYMAKNILHMLGDRK